MDPLDKHVRTDEQVLAVQLTPGQASFHTGQYLPGQLTLDTVFGTPGHRQKLLI